MALQAMLQTHTKGLKEKPRKAFVVIEEDAKRNAQIEEQQRVKDLKQAGISPPAAQTI